MGKEYETKSVEKNILCLLSNEHHTHNICCWDTDGLQGTRKMAYVATLHSSLDLE